ncbi:protein of unknown function [Candidatus Promineifilum breve]|uniref:Uncharacterized protein n=1 Tax=Candidatus Promineifilum breve TaxID=1806508 RepID=A0A160T4X3_9CHLR|nr:protein of unknown function [Candidatus Promineifilum breve]
MPQLGQTSDMAAGLRIEFAKCKVVYTWPVTRLSDSEPHARYHTFIIQ